MKQKIEIEVPEGKKAVWKNGRIEFEDVYDYYPTSWSDFCDHTYVSTSEQYIGETSLIHPIFPRQYVRRSAFHDKNVLPNYRAAEQHLALMQLHQLRDYYRKGWKPEHGEDMFAISTSINGTITITRIRENSQFLSFRTRELAKKFLTNFEDLIRQAGDLI